MRSYFSAFVIGLAIVSAAPSAVYARTISLYTGGTTSYTFFQGETGSKTVSVNGLASSLSVSGTLPAGVTATRGATTDIESELRFDGTPATEGVFPVQVFTKIAGITYGPFPYTLNVFARTLSINPSSIPDGRVGLPFSQTLTAGGSSYIDPTLYWGISDGALPPGLTLNTATGEISGTPTTAGSYRFLVRMNEVGGALRAATAREYTQSVVLPMSSPVSITTRSAPVSGRVGTVYPTQIFRATGGTGSYRWAITAGSLPPGLSLDATTGYLSGTPTTSGTFNASMKAYDRADETNSDLLSVSIVVAPALSILSPGTIVLPDLITPIAGPLAITTTSVANPVVGTDYSASLAASGGTAPYSWNFASGALPPGLSLSAGGVLSGRPTSAGTYTFYIEVFDGVRAFVGRSFTVTVAAASATPIPATPIPTTPIVTPVTPITTPTPGTPGAAASPELTARLANLARIGVAAHTLVKLPDDGNRFTQADSAVYYVGQDGRRHAFPNDRVFFSWYTNFDGVRVVSQPDLASIPLGTNATYKPGVKMVKFTTDPKVYAISNNRTLRWVKTEAAAQALYGSSWNRQIDDIADTFYMDYTFGAEVNAAGDFDRTGILSSIHYVSDTLPL